jgi:uncharacterized protein
MNRSLSARRWVLLLVAVVVIAAAAAVWVALASRADGGGGTGQQHTYLLRPAGRAGTRVSLEVAADEPARARGLSKRRDIPGGSGMVFLFPSDTTAAFWMKDTLVPLQIAFVAADGRVVSLREMAPCRADPCTVYSPTGSYRYAVELPSGAFTAAGVEEGDRVVPEDPSSLPQPS